MLPLYSWDTSGGVDVLQGNSIQPILTLFYYKRQPHLTRCENPDIITYTPMGINDEQTVISILEIESL
jgi:hypothetical protein